MDTQTLKAEPRKVFGRKVKTLRKGGILPVNIYGKGIKSESLQVASADFAKVYGEAGETGLISLKVGEGAKAKEHAVLVANLQKDPVTSSPLHVDFRQVNLKEKIVAKVPVELTGEAQAVKQGLGTVVQHINEIEVEALPTDLPEKFELDVSNLAEIDQAFFVKDIAVDKKVEVKVDPEAIVVKVEPLEKIEEPEVPTEVEGAPAAEAAEGETPTGGGTETSGETQEPKSGEPPRG